ncbi:unnamed protein product [Prunus armeniaca]|uniref:Uncharacterized protein n=1 Tax=Prunus armeniaca TaxID=36596 RepID=A0A6J5THM6_PRUAR|nr:unnamed protein product [Prunus armeniaca]
MAGLGKTTLAKSVYNEDAIDKSFDKRIWVCVSNTFEVNLILGRILELLNSAKTGIQSQEALLKNLKEELTGKRYMLILDDVWNEDDIKWNILMSCLSKLNSAHGSTIIVTTRSANVASIIETLPRYDLKNLSTEDCWSILKHRAFPNGSTPIAPDLERIGKVIAEKCAGIPLVAKVLGGMMHSKNSTDEWLSIQESKIWELPQGEDRIISALKLSFDALKSPSLKQCFAYCSIFMKDVEIERDDLIQLWMAQGLLHSSSSLEMEDIDVVKDDWGIITKCKMHDLVHDLSELVSRYDEEDKLDVGQAQFPSLIPKKISERNAGKLRSLFVNGEALGNILASFKSLRVLKLYRSDIEGLPISIGELKHLRYLDVSETHIKELPKSIGRLYNLQTLRMPSSSSLQTFAKELQNLINLRHVYFNEYIEVPFGIRRLTHLQTLPSFTLDGTRSHGIDELGGLNKLKGELIIRSLEYVRGKDEAKESNLAGKTNIQSLRLEWGNSRERNDDDKEVLDGLEPHPKLESLYISSFLGSKFASWMMSGLPGNLKKIVLSNCRECEVVPTLGHLPNLRHVDFYFMDKLKCLGDEFYGYNQTRPAFFPALKTLRFSSCHALIEWKEATVMSTVAVFPCLEELSLSSLMQLKNAPSHFPSLQKLHIHVLDNVMPIENICSQLTTLTSLYMQGIKELTSLPVGMVEKNQNLRSLIIGHFENLRHLPDGLLHKLPLLDELFISSCPNLELIPITEGLPCLRELKIKDCKKLSSLPSGLKYCTSLQMLSISRCPNLTSIPIPQVLPPSLIQLEFEFCGALTSLAGGLECLTTLQQFSIAYCPKLTSISIHSLTSLRKLFIYDYGPESISSSLEELSLLGCTSLREVNIRNCKGFSSILSGLKSCTSLRSLCVDTCPNLMHLPIDGLQTLVSLEELRICYCPNLEAVPNLDYLTSLRELHIYSCRGLTSIPSGLASCTSLTNLSIDSCPNLVSIAEDVSRLQSLTRLSIYDCGKLQCLPTGLQFLTRLEHLTIGKFSEELDSFPDFEAPSHVEELRLWGWPKLKSLPQQIQHFTSLTSLSIISFNQVEALPEWLGNLTSLTFLGIQRCENLMYLPPVKAMQRLDKLQELVVDGCTRLEERCAKKVGLEWPKISHVPNVTVHGVPAASVILCFTMQGFSYVYGISVVDTCHGLLHGCISHRTKVLFDSMSFTYAISRIRLEIEEETHACDVPVI